MAIQVFPASAEQASLVAEILREAVDWMESSGNSLWRHSDVAVRNIRAEVSAGQFVLAYADGNAVGTMKHQEADEVHWPDALTGEAIYVHKVAIRRSAAGGDVSTALLSWAVAHTRAKQRQFLRLDCDSGRPKLRGVYERFGFAHHSDRQVGPFHISRYQLAVRNVV